MSISKKFFRGFTKSRFYLGRPPLLLISFFNRIDNLLFRFPNLLDQSPEARLDSAKEQAQTQLEVVLEEYGPDVLLSFGQDPPDSVGPDSVSPDSLDQDSLGQDAVGQNRKRRQTADNLQLSIIDVNSLTAVEKPFASGTFEVYFE